MAAAGPPAPSRGWGHSQGRGSSSPMPAVPGLRGRRAVVGRVLQPQPCPAAPDRGSRCQALPAPSPGGLCPGRAEGAAQWADPIPHPPRGQPSPAPRPVTPSPASAALAPVFAASGKAPATGCGHCWARARRRHVTGGPRGCSGLQAARCLGCVCPAQCGVLRRPWQSSRGQVPNPSPGASLGLASALASAPAQRRCHTQCPWLGTGLLDVGPSICGAGAAAPSPALPACPISAGAQCWGVKMSPQAWWAVPVAQLPGPIPGPIRAAPACAGWAGSNGWRRRRATRERGVRLAEGTAGADVP